MIKIAIYVKFALRYVTSLLYDSITNFINMENKIMILRNTSAAVENTHESFVSTA